MPSEQLLSDTRRMIRQYLDALPDEEPVDLIFLAAVLQNFDPARQVPMWLVIVGAPGTGKSKLIDTLQGWAPVFTLANAPNQGYFLTTKTGAADESPLKRMKRDKKRIMLWSDVTSLTSVHRNVANDIHSQLIGIHDGFLYRESGMTSKEQVYRVDDVDRLGCIAAGTERWYQFQREYNTVGTRFSCYYWGRDRWHVTGDLETIMEGGERQTGLGSRYADARSAVIRFLETLIPEIPRSFAGVDLDRLQVRRIAAVIKLLSRAQTAPGTEGDSGRRLALRSAHLARMLAWMSGREQVAEYDLQVVFRFILAQVPPSDVILLRYMLRDRAPARVLDLSPATGLTRRVVDRLILRWWDVGLAEAPPKRKTAWRLSKLALQLADIAQIQPTMAELTAPVMPAMAPGLGDEDVDLIV